MSSKLCFLRIAVAVIALIIAMYICEMTKIDKTQTSQGCPWGFPLE